MWVDGLGFSIRKQCATVATPALFEICPRPALPASRCGDSSWRFGSRPSS